jgi:hypothetical protein
LSTLGTKTNPYIKDPNAELDYTVNWAAFLNGDTIATVGGSTWTVPDGIVNEQDTKTTTTTTIWLSGGTVGTKYALLNRIFTTGGRTDDRTIYVKVKQK